MSSIDSSTNRHLRSKDLDAETILNLIAIEDSARRPQETDADFGLGYAPLIMETVDKWEITSGAFNHPPQILDMEKNYAVKRGQTLTIDFTATDANNDTLVWSKTGVGTIDSTTGIYTYTPNLSTALGSKTVTIRVTDQPPGSLTPHTDTVQIQINVLTENRAPTLRNPNNQTTRVGQTLTVNLAATDPDNDPLTYSTTATFGNIDPSTGIYTFEPTATQSATSVTFTVTDPLGLSASRTISITVLEEQTDPPVLSTIPNKHILRNQTLTVQAAATNPKSQTLTYTQSSTRGSITAAGLFTYSRAAAGAETITITVTDADGFSDSLTFVINTYTTFPPHLSPPTLTITSQPQQQVTAPRAEHGINQIYFNFIATNSDGTRITDTSQIKVTVGYTDSHSGNMPTKLIASLNPQLTATYFRELYNIQTGAAGTYYQAFAIITITGNNGLTTTKQIWQRTTRT